MHSGNQMQANRTRAGGYWYLSDSQGILDAQKTSVPDLPLVLRQQLQQDVYSHGNAAVIHVAQGHAQCLGTSLSDRSHHLNRKERATAC